MNLRKRIRNILTSKVDPPGGVRLAGCVRRRINTQLDTLAYDFTHYSLPHFIDFLSCYRHRPIHVVYFPSRIKTPIGLWLPQESVDYVVVTDNDHLHPLLQEHIILHEIAHILLQHPVIPLPVIQELIGGAPGAVMMGRSIIVDDHALLDNHQEQEAEYMAAMIQQRIQRSQARQLSSIEGMGRLARYLAFRQTQDG